MTVVSNDGYGEKFFYNCSTDRDNREIPQEFQKGDFIKHFGQVRRSIEENDKEPTNVCILDSKILKTKGQEEKKNFILRAIKKHKAECK